MLTIDVKGLRSKEIKVNGEKIKIDDYREIARIFTKNPKYLDENKDGKSIYLIPDNYIHDLQRLSSSKGHGILEDDIESHISEAKSKSGRAGRKIKKKDMDLIKHLHQAYLEGNALPEEDIEEYIDYLKNESKMGYGHPGEKEVNETKFKDRKKAISDIYKKSKISIKCNLTPLHTSGRELTFSVDEFDWIDPKTGELDIGEIVPLPITNFTKEQIDDIRLGKTAFFIKKRCSATRAGIWKEVFVKGNHVETIKEQGYNNEEVCTEPDKEPRFIKYEPTGIEMVEITYIYGPNRSGKTYYGAKYATLWSEMFEDWPIFLFSRRDKDKVLDDIPSLSRVAIDQSLIDNPLSMTDFEHSLVIFDDIDTIADKKLCKAVQKLRDDIMETGRQKMIYVINTSHLGANYGPTRTVLNEANSYTIFPRKGNYEHNFRILKDKMGMKPEVIRQVMDRPNGIAFQGKWGWVTIYKDSPQYIISEVGVRLL